MSLETLTRYCLLGHLLLTRMTYRWCCSMRRYLTTCDFQVVRLFCTKVTTLFVRSLVRDIFPMPIFSEWFWRRIQRL